MTNLNVRVSSPPSVKLPLLRVVADWRKVAIYIYQKLVVVTINTTQLQDDYVTFRTGSLLWRAERRDFIIIKYY